MASDSMDRTPIILYDALELSGLVLLSAVFCSAFISRRIVRASIWFNMLTAGILSTVGQVLLLRRQTGPEPGRAICFLQAILVYPLVVLCFLVGAALLLQVYLSMHFARKSRIMPSSYIIWINIVPIFVFLCVLILSFGVGAHNPSIVARDPSGMRCHFVPNTVSNITVGLSMVGGTVIMVLEGIVLANLYLQREVYNEVLIRNKLSARVILRVCIFNIIMMVVMISGAVVWFIKGIDDAAKFRVSNLTMAMLPLGEGLVLGTQRDIMEVWLSWIGIKRSMPMSPSKKG